MKKLCLMMCIISLVLCLCGCGKVYEQDTKYPQLEYFSTEWRFDKDNRTFPIKDGYILDQSHSYDIVETEDGYSFIIYFVKEGAE